MNYKESQLILEEIKKANKILLNCHRGPDPDSVGSAFALYEVLKVYFEKDVIIVCPDDLPENTKFLEDGLTEKLVFEKIDFSKFDFSVYDLFIIVDSGSWSMVRGGGNNNSIDINTVVIDHHPTNERFGKINLVDETMSSTAELLYFIFNDWGVDPDSPSIDYYPRFEEMLLTGIIGDTGCFKFSNVDMKTMKVAMELMKYSSKDKIIFNLFQTNSESSIKAFGVLLTKFEVDKENKFAYTVLSNEEYNQFKPEDMAKELASTYIQSVQGTDFGFVAIEDKPNELSISFRSRTNVDTSVIAAELGGGGHKVASGAKIRNIDFKEAVEKVLAACRKYANKNS